MVRRRGAPSAPGGPAGGRPYAGSISIDASTVTSNDSGYYYGVISSSGTFTNSTFSGNSPFDYGASSGSLAACASGTVSF